MMSTRTAAFVFSLVFSSLMAGSLHAGTFVTWDDSVPGIIEGTADGVNVSVAFSPDPPEAPTIGSTNMTGSDYDPPGGSNQSYVAVDSDIGITWTFDQPVEDLLLYLNFWRGSQKNGPPDNLYTFDQPPSIKSGLADGSVSGNSFIASSVEWNMGILSFPGPLTSLSLLTPGSATLVAEQRHTMSFNAVPEPASAALLLGAAGTVGLWRCRRRGSASLADGTGSGG